MKNTAANSPWRRGRPPPCRTRSFVRPRDLSHKRERHQATLPLNGLKGVTPSRVNQRPMTGRGNSNREETKFWSSGQHSSQEPTALIGPDRALKHLACRPRNTCFRADGEGEDERERVDLSCSWHFLSSMNHVAAEKIFLHRARGKTNNPRSSAALQSVLPTRAERSLQIAVAKTTFQQFLPHPNHPLQSRSRQRRRWRGQQQQSMGQSNDPSPLLPPRRPSATAARRPVRRPPLQQSGPTSPATFFPNPFIWRRYRT